MNRRGLICKQYGLPYCGKPEKGCDSECAIYEPSSTCNVGKWNQCVIGCSLMAKGTGCFGGFKPRVERKRLSVGKE